MSKLDTWRRWLVAFVFVYVLISCLSRATAYKTSMYEVFPFFAWTLFSRVPNESYEFAIQIRELNGDIIDPPEFLGSFGAPFGRYSSPSFQAVQEWGAALAKGNTDLAERKQDAFEQRFLAPKVTSLQYEFVKRRYDVLERWEKGTFREVKVIGSYALGETK